MYPFERFTEDAKKVLTLAQEEAERGHHSYIGTEHLLLGVMRGPGPGGETLRTLNVQIEVVRRAVETVIGRSEMVAYQPIIPTSRVKKVIELSFEQGRREGHKFVDSGHLLVALTLEGEGIAAQVLKDSGVTRQRVVDVLRSIRKVTPGPAVQPEVLTGADTEALLGLVQTPHLARLLASKGLDVEAVEELLLHPPQAVLKLRRSIAQLRVEMDTVVSAGDFEKAANLQKGEKELLKRLVDAEQKWIDGLQPR